MQLALCKLTCAEQLTRSLFVPRGHLRSRRSAVLPDWKTNSCGKSQPKPKKTRNQTTKQNTAMSESLKAISAEICPVIAASGHMCGLQKHVMSMSPRGYQLQENLQRPRSTRQLVDACFCGCIIAPEGKQKA